MLYLARAQRQQNQLNEAVGSLESLLENYGDSALLDQVYYHLGEFQYAGNQFPAAIAAYDRVIQDYASSAYVPLALYGKGWSEMKSMQFEQAATTFSTLLDEHPDSINAGGFANTMVENASASRIVDFPASYHNGAAGICFADGHGEIKRWSDPRTTPPPTYDGNLQLNFF